MHIGTEYLTLLKLDRGASSTQILLIIGFIICGNSWKYLQISTFCHRTRYSLPPQPRSPSVGVLQQPPSYALQQELRSENAHLRDENTRLHKETTHFREKVSQLERSIREMKDKKDKEKQSEFLIQCHLVPRPSHCPVFG